VLDHFFLEARCKLLDLAAILDRIGRGDGVASLDGDPRREKFTAALRILQGDEPNKAEQIQQLFSQGYDPAWQRPQPRG
jgi:hypothetical protein